jgi:hypothetical protein
MMETLRIQDEIVIPADQVVSADNLKKLLEEEQVSLFTKEQAEEIIQKYNKEQRLQERVTTCQQENCNRPLYASSEMKSGICASCRAKD